MPYVLLFQMKNRIQINLCDISGQNTLWHLSAYPSRKQVTEEIFSLIEERRQYKVANPAKYI